MFALAFQTFNSPQKIKTNFPGIRFKIFYLCRIFNIPESLKKWGNKTEKFTPIQTVKIRSRKSNSNFSVPHINHFEERPICHNNADKHKKIPERFVYGEKWNV